MKWCPSCELVLSLESFGRNRSTNSGIATYCRNCAREKSKESRTRLHGSSRHYHLVRRYGIGEGDVRRMLNDQRFLCPICFCPISPTTGHVDHDHVTGEVRRILCFNCNGGLGQFRDDPDALRRAAAYVEGQVSRPFEPAPGVVSLAPPRPLPPHRLPRP